MIDSIRISATMTGATGSCGSLISYNDWKTVYQSGPTGENFASRTLGVNLSFKGVLRLQNQYLYFA
jgi:hypothetical protein